MTLSQMKKPEFAIINDCDAPEPRMVVQLCKDGLYRYMEREDTLKRHVMKVQPTTTDIQDFGFAINKRGDEVIFQRVDGLGSIASYADYRPRYWQDSADTFKHKKVNK